MRSFRLAKDDNNRKLFQAALRWCRKGGSVCSQVDPRRRLRILVSDRMPHKSHLQPFWAISDTHLMNCFSYSNRPPKAPEASDTPPLLLGSSLAFCRSRPVVTSRGLDSPPGATLRAFRGTRRFPAADFAGGEHDGPATVAAARRPIVACATWGARRGGDPRRATLSCRRFRRLRAPRPPRVLAARRTRWVAAPRAARSSPGAAPGAARGARREGDPRRATPSRRGLHRRRARRALSRLTKARCPSRWNNSVA